MLFKKTFDDGCPISFEFVFVPDIDSSKFSNLRNCGDVEVEVEKRKQLKYREGRADKRRGEEKKGDG